MPELPEVETVRRQIAPVLQGECIESVQFSHYRLRFPTPRLKIREIAQSGPVQSVDRLGKYLIVRFSTGDWILHLGMSGNVYKKNPGSKHVHVTITTPRQQLYFVDPRRFGFLDAFYKYEKNNHFQNKGPDALRQVRSGMEIHSISRRLSCSIKAFQLNQKHFSGIGNIYASEILFHAGISPRKMSRRLKREQCDRLSVCIPEILQDAVDHCGTTFDSFRTPEGRTGEHFDRLAVYNKEGAACRRCGFPIQHLVQQGRSTYYCRQCQKG